MNGTGEDQHHRNCICLYGTMEKRNDDHIIDIDFGGEYYSHCFEEFLWMENFLSEKIQWVKSLFASDISKA